MTTKLRLVHALEERGKKRTREKAFVILDVEVTKNFACSIYDLCELSRSNTVFKDNPGLLEFLLKKFNVSDTFMQNVAKNKGLSPEDVVAFVNHSSARFAKDEVPCNPVFEQYCLENWRNPEAVVNLKILFAQSFFAAEAVKEMRVAKVDFDSVSGNPGLPFATDHGLLREFEDHWNWKKLLDNPALVISKSDILRQLKRGFYTLKTLLQSRIIADPQLFPHMIDLITEKVGFEIISKNPHIQFTDELIREHAEDWDWEELSQNASVVFTRQLLLDFEKKWNWKSVSRNPLLFKHDPAMFPYVVGLLTDDIWNNEALFDIKVTKKTVIMRKVSRLIKELRFSKTPQSISPKLRTFFCLKGVCFLANDENGTNPMHTTPVDIKVDDIPTEQTMTNIPCVKEMIKTSSLPEEIECVICCGRSVPEDLVFMVPCFHLFHKTCINRCNSGQCPLCRRCILDTLPWNEARSVVQRSEKIFKAVDDANE